MEQFRRYIAIAVTVCIPVMWGGAASAQAYPNTQDPPKTSLANVQEIKVTAVVPGHIDIVVNSRGDIIEVFSNTTEDVTPQVYLLEASPQNKRELTSATYDKYRKIVPGGSVKYGKLFEAKSSVLATITNGRRS
jgi:hypothetical protein